MAADETNDVVSRVSPLEPSPTVPRVGPDPTTPCGARIKAFAFMHLLDWVEATWGAGAVASWVETLPDAVRPQADRRTLTPVAWVSLDLYHHLTTFIVGRFMGGDPRRGLVLGYVGALRDINAFYRAAIGLASPAFVLTLSGRTWRTYYDFGALKVVAKASGGCTAEVTGWPFSDPVTWYELCGGLVAWMDASRARDMRLTRLEETAPGTLRIEAAWS